MIMVIMQSLRFATAHWISFSGTTWDCKDMLVPCMLSIGLNALTPMASSVYGWQWLIV